MVSLIKRDADRTPAPFGRIAASLAAIVSLVRVLPLFFCGRPRTSLRVLCLAAIDTVHLQRYSRRLSSHAVQTLASLLDFGACANDFFDHDSFSHREYCTTRRLLEGAQTGVAIDEYMSRLRHAEHRRPPTGGDDSRHRQTQLYRESVIRLSLGMIAATVLDNASLEEGIRATHRDEDMETLYRIVMLCQIIDDVVDFPKDADEGLPSFLTAHASPAQATALTGIAARRYADRSGLPCSPHLFPFRAALLGTSVLARVVVMLRGWQLRWRADRTPSAPGRIRQPDSVQG